MTAHDFKIDGEGPRESLCSQFHPEAKMLLAYIPCWPFDAEMCDTCGGMVTYWTPMKERAWAIIFGWWWSGQTLASPRPFESKKAEPNPTQGIPLWFNACSTIGCASMVVIANYWMFHAVEGHECDGWDGWDTAHSVAIWTWWLWPLAFGYVIVRAVWKVYRDVRRAGVEEKAEEGKR